MTTIHDLGGGACTVCGHGVEECPGHYLEHESPQEVAALTERSIEIIKAFPIGACDHRESCRKSEEPVGEWCSVCLAMELRDELGIGNTDEFVTASGRKIVMEWGDD